MGYFEGALQELGSKTNFETLCKSYSDQIKKLQENGINLQGITPEDKNDEDDNNDR